MSNTTAKRGRPAKSTQKTKEAEVVIPSMKPEKKEIPLMTEYELTRKNGRIFMMGSGPANVYSEELQQLTPIRYCKDEPSIYVSEQTSNPTKTPIIFENGKLFVDRAKPNLLAYLNAHPSNEANGGNLFRKVDNTKVAKVELDAEYLVVDALSLLRSKPLDAIISVATALGVNTDRPVDEIKHDMLVFAKTRPETFIDSFDNPVVEAKAKILKAMSMGVIAHSRGHMRWTDTNKHILAIPVGQDPADVFTRFCMTETGSVVLSEIERQL